MSFKHWIYALLLSTCGLASAQPRVLYDVRIPTPAPRIQESEWQRIRFLAKKAEALNLWGDSYCEGQDLSIIGAAAGAFTTPNVKQTAYLYSACLIVHNYTNQGLIIMQGQQVVAHYIFRDHFQEMYSLKDINKNGYSELALIRRISGQGTTFDYLMVAELRPNRRFLLFEKVNYNDCGNFGREGWNSQVIRVTPATTPTFTKQLLSGRCDGADPFRRISSQGAIKPLPVKPEPTGWKAAPTN